MLNIKETLILRIPLDLHNTTTSAELPGLDAVIEYQTCMARKHPSSRSHSTRVRTSILASPAFS